MMRLFLFGWSLSMLLFTPAWAQIREFPYEGLIETDSAYARSGPGKQFYPTERLNRGTRVTVHRHDPGGWYMIAPLPGSFSWVRAEYIQKTGPNRGIITENNVVVRVGSSFGDETRDVEQVRLAKNDQVEILDEKTLSTPAGMVKYVKIVPPAGEYRWVSGKFVTPVNQIVRQQQDQDPFALPSVAKQAPPEEANIANNKPPRLEAPGQVESTANKTSDAPAVHRTGPDPQVLAAQRERLDELDKEFREMVNGRTADWSFTALEQGYLQLQQEAVLPALASQIDLRMTAIHRYRGIKQEYDELKQLTAETRRRDAQLMSIQQEQPADAEGESPLMPTPDPVSQEPAGNPGPVQLPGVEPVEQNPPPGPPRQSTQPTPRFDGAGIVQRAATAGAGTPAYVLITPQGRVLAYLQPVAGLDLAPYVGKAMGLYGQRSYRPELRTDLIIVRSLTPVRLAP